MNWFPPTYVGLSLDGNQIHVSTFAGDGVTALEQDTLIGSS